MATRRSQDALLAGDIGGTNARLRLYDVTGTVILDETTLPSAKAKSLEELLAPYVEKQRVPIRAAVLGVAGPVRGGIAKTTNLPWVVSEKRLSRDLGIGIVRVINDLAAIALGCERMPPEALAMLHAGKPTTGTNLAVIAAGTGLGEAFLVWDGEGYVACASEGGHSSFAPRTPIEADLLAYLRHRIPGGHVSYERVVSGPGLGTIYDYLLTMPGSEEPASVKRQLAKGDRNAAIAELGLSGQSRVAEMALELFASAYGAEAGNLVLKGMAIGGLFLAGTIAKTILPSHRDVFLRAMFDKGRMQPLLEDVPVAIVLDERAGLAGAGHLAAKLLAM